MVGFALANASKLNKKFGVRSGDPGAPVPVLFRLVGEKELQSGIGQSHICRQKTS